MREQQASVAKGDLQSKPGEDWNFQAAVIEFGMLLRDSEFAGTSSAKQIRSLLDDGGVEGSDEREGFADLVDLAFE